MTGFFLHGRSRRRLLLHLASTAAAIRLAENPADAAQQPQDADMQAPSSETDSDPGEHPLPQPGLPTLGGRLFWGDVHFRRGYRIQQNVFSGHFRLLDPGDRRCASGTLDECRMALDQIVRSRQLAPETGHVVICLHGIGRSSKSMNPVIRALAAENMTAVPFDYPGNRSSLAECANCLRQVVESLSGAEQLSFVVHSMGGLVVRRYLQDHSDHRHFRMVMLGTPNLGADLAAMLKNFVLFKAVFGPAGQELAAGAESIAAALPVPDFPFGIIAGGRGDDRGFNPLLRGDDDGTVTVACTRLPGVADFLRVNRLHSLLMSDPQVCAAICCFLKSGRFSSERSLEPIPTSD
ncbi:MAG: esterase/lipase family protein [Planctomycetota bacterium]